MYWGATSDLRPRVPAERAGTRALGGHRRRRQADQCHLRFTRTMTCPHCKTGRTLNLAWTQGECSLLTVDVHGVVSQFLERERAQGLPYIGSYMVKDPYGEGELGDAVAGQFGVDRAQVSVSCGSGVGPLLHNLTVLAAGASVYFASDVYPDVPVWVDRFRGHRIGPRRRGNVAQVQQHLRTIEETRPALVVLERPALTSSPLSEPEELNALCGVAARSGTLVVVDESNAN